jgi:hypothetical protein
LFNATGRFGKRKELGLLVGGVQAGCRCSLQQGGRRRGGGRDGTNEWSGTDASFWRKHMENREDEVNDQIAKFICTGLRGFSFESQSPSLVYSLVLGPKFG